MKKTKTITQKKEFYVIKNSKKNQLKNEKSALRNRSIEQTKIIKRKRNTKRKNGQKHVIKKHSTTIINKADRRIKTWTEIKY